MAANKYYLIALVCVSILFAGTQAQGFVTGNTLRTGYVPSPRLMKPSGDVVTLSEGPLLFKWSSHEGLGRARKSYDFRIYRGYEMVEDTLLFKDKVPGSRHTIEISPDLFEDGKVYTWSLRTVYRGIGKSSRSSSSFTIIKQMD
ncbi:MAG: hypothetical protein P9L88_03295 [Candidatus Tantalella remota]|nr:hypothetical protein [Candidatus Tantalella remota]